MNRFRNIIGLMIVIIFAISCEKEIDNLDKLNGVKAPTNVSAIFDIATDNTGLVTIVPSAEGVTEYMVTFGDDATAPAEKYGINEVITHTYGEGTFNVGITASGLTGLTSKYEQEINVTFKAPENLVVTITADAVNPRIVTITATADYATIMDIYFGDVENEEPTHALPGEGATHTYAEPGDYLVTVIAKSGGTSTTEYTETITISAASDPVNLPIDFESFTVNYMFENFGSAESTVIDNPDASGINSSARVAQMLKASGAETWAGSLLTLENPIDFSTKKLFKVKVWSPKSGAVVKFKVENLDNNEIALEVDATTSVSNAWEELSYDFSAINMAEEYQKVVIFFDFGNVGDDAIYYFDDIKQASSAPGTGIVGTWKMAPEAGSLGVGPTQGDISWWSIDAAGVTLRACFFDDEYIFGTDGSFSNVLGAESWIEGWQGGGDACGAPVAPHDGSNPATYIYDATAGTVTLNGTGSYLGIPKAVNGAELTSPDEAPASITYIMELSENDMVMTVDIHIAAEGSDGWWRFKLVKEGGGSVPSPLEGTWQMAPEAGSFGVGPAQGDISWWSIDAAGVTARACFFDDTYVFGADGSFSNVLGAESWIEGWQGGSEACGSPVAPHDGSNPATYVYDATAGTLTLNGIGSYLGIPKAVNGFELASPDEAPESVTYILELSEDNTVLTADIHIAPEGSDGWWRFKLIKN